MESSPSPPSFSKMNDLMQHSSYFADVKDKFGKDSEEVEAIHDILFKLNENRIDYATALGRVKVLFNEHSDLIEEFNMLWPDKLKTELPLEEEPPLITKDEEAIALMTKISDRFKTFNTLLALHKDSRIDKAGVAAKLKELFKDHRDIIATFNLLLPKENEIILPPENEGSSANRSGIEEKALEYARVVRERFKEDHEKYTSFLELMRNFRSGRIEAEDIARAKELFKVHDDLIEELNVFLPDKYKITLPLENEQPPSESSRDKGKGPLETEQPSQNLSTTLEDKIKNPFDQHDTSARTSTHDASSSDPSYEKLWKDLLDIIDEDNNIAVDKAVKYITQARDIFQAQPEKFQTFLQLERERDDAHVASHVRKLLEERRNKILGLNYFLPKEHQIELSSEQPVTRNEALMALTQRTQQDSETFNALLDHLEKSNHNSNNTASIAARGKELVQGHKDLTLRLNAFLATEHEITVPRVDSRSGKEQITEEDTPRLLVYSRRKKDGDTSAKGKG